MLRSIYLTLLAALLLGTDVTISDAEFFQTINVSTSNEFSTLPSSQSQSSTEFISTSTTSSTPSTESSSSTSSSLTSTSLSSVKTIRTTSVTPNTNVAIPEKDVVIGSSSYQLNPNELYASEFAPPQPRNVSSLETNVTVQIGSHAYLPCNVHRLLNKPVSWVRVRDGHILTVDQTTFIADQRFQSIFRGEEDHTWSLQIKYVSDQDLGWYECQVSTEPKLSARVYLKVVVPKTELIGDANRFVKAGSKVALHCIVRGSIEPPTYIIWFQGNQQISQDNGRGWYMQIDREIFGNSSDQQNTIGSLIIPSVRKKDTGNYTCTPSNSVPVTVDLHVLSGEYSASAIMSAAVINKQNFFYLLLLLLLFAIQRT